MAASLLYFYYFIGNALETSGDGKVTVYYLSGQALTIIFGFIYWGITGRSFQLSAYYLNLSMFFSFATLYPETRCCCFLYPDQDQMARVSDAAYCQRMDALPAEPPVVCAQLPAVLRRIPLRYKAPRPGLPAP